MGRLDCKDASLIAFEALRHDADLFITVSDEDAQAAARLYEAMAFRPRPVAQLRSPLFRNSISVVRPAAC
jgi:diaminopropionate ammonia-lyase